MRVWNKGIDEKILQIVEQNGGKSYFYNLWKELQISSRTLNEHLKKLVDQDIIQKDANPEIGKKRYIRLTFKTILQKSLEIFEGVKSDRTNKRLTATKTTRNKSIIRMLFGMLATSYVGNLNCDGSVKSHMSGPGRLTSPLIMDLGISTEHILNGKIFTHLINDFSPEEITENISRLRESMILEPVRESNGLTMFDFSQDYENMRSFLGSSYHILDILLSTMKFKWSYVNKRASSDELNWFISVVGSREMRKFFVSIDEERTLRYQTARSNYGKSYSSDKIKKMDKEHIKKATSSIKQLVKELENKHNDIENTHPAFFELVKEMVCPSFIR